MTYPTFETLKLTQDGALAIVTMASEPSWRSFNVSNVG